MGCYGFVVTNYQSFGGDRGSWVYDRIIIVRCDNVIPENRQDKQLVEHLLEEKEYIVSLAIRCLRQVINNGYRYNIPASCTLLNEDYQTENNSFLLFMKECVVDRKPYGKIRDNCTTKKMYDVYEAWCKDNNNGYKETKREVNKLLDEMGKGETKKTNGYIYYKAITLSEETKKAYKNEYDNLYDIPRKDDNKFYYDDYDDNDKPSIDDEANTNETISNVELNYNETETDFGIDYDIDFEEIWSSNNSKNSNGVTDTNSENI